ncbi:MAG: hypothetical protein ACE5KH_02145 [Candidatus Geothermarchaeales archaeon]
MSEMLARNLRILEVCLAVVLMLLGPLFTAAVLAQPTLIQPEWDSAVTDVCGENYVKIGDTYSDELEGLHQGETVVSITDENVTEFKLLEERGRLLDVLRNALVERLAGQGVEMWMVWGKASVEPMGLFVGLYRPTQRQAEAAYAAALSLTKDKGVKVYVYEALTLGSDIPALEEADRRMAYGQRDGVFSVPINHAAPGTPTGGLLVSLAIPNPTEEQINTAVREVREVVGCALPLEFIFEGKHELSLLGPRPSLGNQALLSAVLAVAGSVLAVLAVAFLARRGLSSPKKA